MVKRGFTLIKTAAVEAFDSMIPNWKNNMLKGMHNTPSSKTQTKSLKFKRILFFLFSLTAKGIRKIPPIFRATSIVPKRNAVKKIYSKTFFFIYSLQKMAVINHRHFHK